MHAQMIHDLFRFGFASLRYHATQSSFFRFAMLRFFFLTPHDLKTPWPPRYLSVDALVSAPFPIRKGSVSPLHL